MYFFLLPMSIGEGNSANSNKKNPPKSWLKMYALPIILITADPGLEARTRTKNLYEI